MYHVTRLCIAELSPQIISKLFKMVRKIILLFFIIGICVPVTKKIFLKIAPKIGVLKMAKNANFEWKHPFFAEVSQENGTVKLFDILLKKSSIPIL